MNRLPALLPVPDMAGVLSKISDTNVDDDLYWLLEGIKHGEVKFFSPAGDPGNIDSLAVTLAFLAPTGTPATPEKAKLVDQVLAETCVKPRDVLAYLETTQALANACSPSDATLGKETRRKMKDMATRPREQTTDRKREWKRWYAMAKRIQKEHKRHIYWREMAVLVKKELNLPDSTEIIRRRLSDVHNKRV